MMMILIWMSILSSTMIILLNHPFSLGAILLCQTLIVALITGLMSYNFWYSYMLFLIMIGGMLVLFIYMTSVASNEKFKYSNKVFFMSLMIIIPVIILFLSLDPFFSYMNNQNFMNSNNYINFSLIKFINMPTSLILASVIIYLFITLIAVVKITDINFGPLRQKN
uniref:NADH-ubiquinone oxidoreductase chain 6 n=1 Tax=Sinodendron yunnanense TaxID=618637 RepID=A0A342D3V2_9SCAR|nr:NADH dehydrogenase subunit 6 [Sinodendron yunnanense]AKN01382.1 NADH dehydrogenase subunit 6 [Sinodendron yunnanense]